MKTRKSIINIIKKYENKEVSIDVLLEELKSVGGEEVQAVNYPGQGVKVGVGYPSIGTKPQFDLLLLTDGGFTNTSSGKIKIQSIAEGEEIGEGGLAALSRISLGSKAKVVVASVKKLAVKLNARLAAEAAARAKAIAKVNAEVAKSKADIAAQLVKAKAPITTQKNTQIAQINTQKNKQIAEIRASAAKSRTALDTAINTAIGTRKIGPIVAKVQSLPKIATWESDNIAKVNKWGTDQIAKVNKWVADQLATITANVDAQNKKIDKWKVDQLAKIGG